MRVFTATLGTETDSFSPIPTGLQSFKDTMYWKPGEHPGFPTEATGPLWACRQRAQSFAWDVVEGTCAFAMPGGPTSKVAYETLRDEILGQLEAAMPVNMVALGLHGAMMAHGTHDCEGDLLARVRDLVGSSVAVGAVLDCHAHLTQEMLDNADALVFFKEYPHTDYVDRADELLTLLERRCEGAIRPIMKTFDCEMIAAMPTTVEPMRGFVNRMRTLEVHPILSVSLVHGFMLGDCLDMGTQILVIADDTPELAQKLACQLGHELFSLRSQFITQRRDFDDSLESALALDPADGPIILVDASDNPGGGAPGDSTVLLQALRLRGVGPVCCGPLWDPVAVRFCIEAGVGAQIKLRIGGKVCVDSGTPLDVNANVLGVQREHSQELGKARVPLGDSAAIRFEGITVVLTTLRDQAYDPSLFSGLGVDCGRSRFIVLKSKQQFRIGFVGISERIVEIPSANPRKRDYEFIRRPKWPLDPDHRLN